MWCLKGHNDTPNIARTRTPSCVASQATHNYHSSATAAERVDMVLELVEESLVSRPTFTVALYSTLLIPKELIICDGQDLKITVAKEAVLQEWMDPGSRGMCCIPLEPGKMPMQSEYVLLSKYVA